MKSLQDILKECDLATPGNTIGMGNPMPPTNNTPGSEPICSDCKKGKKKKKVKESLLDNDNDILDQGVEAMIHKWMEEHSSNSSKYTLDKNHNINASVLRIYLEESMPEYIKIDRVTSITYKIDMEDYSGVHNISLNLPKTASNIVIETFNLNSLNLGKNERVDVNRDVYISCEIKHLSLPKKLTCSKLSLGGCTNLIDITGLKNVNTTHIDLPRSYANNIIRDKLKLNEKTTISISGNSI